MTDLTALADLIRADASQRGQTISKLGYFCAPFQPRQGPFSDKVIKVYRGMRDAAALDRLKQCHDDYVDALNAADVGLPDTEFHLLDMAGGRIPVIVQDALPTDRLMRPLMQSQPLNETLEMMEAAGQVIARFWLWAQNDPRRIGFHPSIRNFAYVDGTARFFDTFPPLIHYSRDEMGKMLLTFSDKRLMRMVGPFLQKKVTGIQDEWYDPAETLVGLVGSACRLRPSDAPAYLDWGRDFVKREMQPWQTEALAGLQTPPQLPSYWTGFRKLLGLQGEPNIPQK
ncbi:DUF6206 family protein [Tropicibacter naphthalenivorans]|uniref:Phosphotransferase enzyme family protein n=1 Tax=Tropicibacter naphthalenivorans TaxID=441103 RepID=A0A0P1G1A0_9RHOB|nr:DUF6206 family protein [Tropicibacter naphthalenivorans]CUH75374.1 hypothetical protein TRN7648_00407 [Tropicibacter naphthalenivorans]SMC44771.1 hypothetical protein SAMN04488093_101472 [Tropicibacter naphthalenivorans]